MLGLFGLGYAQDNWYVNGWYGVDNTSDLPKALTPLTADGDASTDNDRTTFSRLKPEDTTAFVFRGRCHRSGQGESLRRV